VTGVGKCFLKQILSQSRLEAGDKPQNIQAPPHPHQKEYTGRGMLFSNTMLIQLSSTDIQLWSYRDHQKRNISVGTVYHKAFFRLG
jgi:hypothetical protein